MKTSQATFVMINTTKTTLGPSSLVQYLHGKGLFTDYIYAPRNADDLYTAEELSILTKEVSSYDIVGISSFTISEKRAFQLAQSIKSANPKLHVILGGPNVIMDPERILIDSGADSVCIYEGEIPVEKLIRTFRTGNITKIPGLWFTRGRKIIKNEYAEVIQNLDLVPFENYKKSSFGTFKRLTNSGFDTETTMAEQIENPCMNGRVLYIMTTRGCPYSCAFCVNATLNSIAQKTGCNRIRRMSPESIVSGLQCIAAKEPDIQYVFFFDDDFFLRSEEDLTIFAGLYQKNVRLPFYVFANPNSTTNRMLDIAAQAGISSIEFGVQTVSESVLNEYNRMQNADHLRRVLNHITKQGYKIQVSFDLITNSPFETPKDIIQNIHYVLSLPGNFELYVHSLHIFPGSQLHKSHRGGTGNECHEYQDNFYDPMRFYNEFYTKLLFAMQGFHNSEDPDKYGPLSRQEILSKLEKQKEQIELLDTKMKETRVGQFYKNMHNL
jgi:anaerobic magnesium-protoporphyrin IX monomethyl ester cyclase